MRKIKVLVALGVLLIAAIGTTAIASADDNPFLCPVVGDGVLNADEHNGENGVSTIDPPVGTSILPGQNKAGENSNSNAYNTQPPVEGSGPGGNPDFSPIWPHPPSSP